MISFSRPSFSCPKPGPPSSSSRKIAHRPCALISSCSPLTIALIFGSFDRTAYGKTYSSGSISSRQNSSTQSSFFWNSGSVEKSHAIVRPSPVATTLRAAQALAPTLAHPAGRPGTVRLSGAARTCRTFTPRPSRRSGAVRTCRACDPRPSRRSGAVRTCRTFIPRPSRRSGAARTCRTFIPRPSRQSGAARTCRAFTPRPSRLSGAVRTCRACGPRPSRRSGAGGRPATSGRVGP